MQHTLRNDSCADSKSRRHGEPVTSALAAINIKSQKLTACPSCCQYGWQEFVRGHVGLFTWDNPSTLPHGTGETFLSTDFSCS